MKYEEIIKNSPLFKGMSGAELEYALKYYAAKEKKYKKGDFLNTIGGKLPAFGLVLSGVVQVHMDELDGSSMIMATVSQGRSFGESLSYLQKDAMVYICAATDCTVLWLNPAGIRSNPTASDNYEAAVIRRFTALMAERALEMNNRVQILSKVSIREKLNTFFAQLSQESGSKDITLPFNRNDMAVYLGVNRSALCRELSRMKDEGIIEYRKNKFTIL